MISSALSFLVSDLNSYFRSTLALQEDRVILSSISQIDGSLAENNTDKVVVSLINIAEEPATRTNAGMPPALSLDLHVLCSSSFNDYAESLKFISGVVAFFHSKNVFNHSNSPALADRVDKMIVELAPASFRDMANIWGMLGSKYQPCVLYKVSVLSAPDGVWESAAPL